MTRMSTTSFGNANMREIIGSPEGGSGGGNPHPPRYARPPLPQCGRGGTTPEKVGGLGSLSQPEPRPQEARLQPVDEFGNQPDGFAADERQTAQERQAAPVGRNRPQPDLVAVPGPHDGAQFADPVDQAALHRHAAGQDVAGEQGLVGPVG